MSRLNLLVHKTKNPIKTKRKTMSCRCIDTRKKLFQKSLISAIADEGIIIKCESGVDEAAASSFFMFSEKIDLNINDG